MHFTNNETNTLLIQDYLSLGPIDPIKSDYLDEYQKASLTSPIFFDNILKPLLKLLLSNHLEKVLDFVDEINKKIPFIRKSIIFDNQATSWDTDNSGIYGLLFEDEINQLYQEMGNLDWHSLNQGYYGTTGAFLTAARRAMVSNISQSPLIVAQHTKQNKLGLPSYYPISQITISSNTPKFIVYIGTVNMVLIYMLY
jgi:hypothetical protein